MVTFMDPKTCGVRVAPEIDAAFDDMPGLRLTKAQVRRLWQLREEECTAALGHLVRIGHLVRGEDGQYEQHPRRGLSRQPHRAAQGTPPRPGR